MRSQFLLLALIACLTGSPALAAIYKTVDEEGNVVFTDVPPKDQSKAIEIDAGNTYQPAPLPAANTPAPAAADEAETEEELTVNYESLQITAPADDEALRENAGNVTISVSANPSLDIEQGHAVQILVDGTPSTSAAATSLSLTNVDRGTHSLVAQILDADGQVLISSSPVTFHMLRYAVPPVRIQPIRTPN